MADNKDKVVIWPSSKIRYAYLLTNYYKKAGTIGSSCMRYKDNQKALNFYIRNKVKIAVIVTKDNKIKARALLWENVSKIDKKKTYTYLDRVYYSEENQRAVYLQFAKDNKFLYHSKDKRYLYIKEINLDNVTHLPYADTFNTLWYEDKILCHYGSGAILKLTGSTLSLSNLNNGGYVPKLDKDATQEVFTKTWVSKKDCIKIKKYKGYVGKVNIIDINGDYYSIYDRKNISNIKGGYCLKKNVVEEYITKDKIDKTKAILVTKYDSYVHKDNIVYVNKITYSKHDKAIVSIKNKYCLVSRCYYSDILEKHILKDGAIRAYRLERIKFRDLYIFKDISYQIKKKNLKIHIIKDLRGLFKKQNNNNSVFYNTQQDNKTPEFVGPYYIDNSCPCVILNTGEYIIKDGLDIKYLIRRNKKYYLRHLHEFKDKKQLLFDFMKV